MKEEGKRRMKRARKQKGKRKKATHTMSERKGRKKEKLAGETKIVRYGILDDFNK
jgi:hypothetical protein